MFALSFRSCLRLAVLGGGLAASPFAHAADGAGAGASLEQSVPSRNRAMAAAPDRARSKPLGAMTTLPDEAIASVRNHAYVNGLRQDILLKGGAARGTRNSITLLARTSRVETLDEQVPLYKPTETGIRSEIGGQFPRLTMQVVERESHNSYGPYGLALGRDGTDVRCAYMWQWIDANRLPADAGMTGPVSLRVRLCKAGTTFDAMAAEIDRLTISGAASMERVASSEPMQIIEAPRQAPAPNRVHRKPSRRLAAAHKRELVARQDAPDATSISPVPGPRYMSPSPVGIKAPATAMIAPTVPTQLSGDLPAEAYRGPAATKTATTKSY